MGRKTTFTLLEATLTVYPEGSDGQAVLSSPVFRMCCAESLRMNSDMIAVETWATAALHPRQRHLGERHVIEVERLWSFNKETLMDYILQPNRRYVLVMSWEDARNRVWIARTWYGVMDASHEVGQGASNQNLRASSSHRWTAEYWVPSSGTGTVAPSVPASALTVWWRNGAELLLLFTYDSDTHLFTEASAGVSTGRATITALPSLSVSIESTEALKVDGAVLVAGEFVVASGIGPVETPRLEFRVGSRRVASLGKNGVMRVTALSEGPPAGGSSVFEFYGASGLVAVLGIAGLVAQEVQEI